MNRRNSLSWSITRATVTRRGAGRSAGSALPAALPPLRIGDRVAVRVDLRPAEHLVDAIDQPLADHVLELLGLVVHLVPA